MGTILEILRKPGILQIPIGDFSEPSRFATPVISEFF
jgi:hypothetical protein